MSRPAEYRDLSDTMIANGTLGVQIARRKGASPEDLKTLYKKVPLAMRNLDPVSSRFDELSEDLYINNAVPTYLSGKGDFVYNGQKPGYYCGYVPKPVCNYTPPFELKKASNSWRTLKIESPVTYKSESNYTNTPALF